MPDPAYIGTGATATTATLDAAIAPPLPAGALPGHLALLVAVAVNFGTGAVAPTVPTPGDWTPVQVAWASGFANTRNPRVYAFARILPGVPAAPSLTMTGGSGGGTSNQVLGVVLAFSDATLADLLAGAAAIGDTNPPSAPSPGTVRAGSMLVGVAGLGNSAAMSPNGAWAGTVSGTAERVDTAVASRLTLAVSTALKAAAGDPGVFAGTWSTNVGPWGAFQIALQPLPEPGAPVPDPAPVPSVPSSAARVLTARGPARTAYRWELVDAITRAPLAEIVGATERTFSFVRNRPGSASFRLPLGMPEPLRSLLRAGGELDLWVWRAGVPVWGGALLGAQPDLATPGGSVTFAALGIGELLADRYTAAPYSISAREQTTAAFDLITVAQARANGSLAIDAGALPDSVARTLEWQTPSPILGAIETMADSDRGFDFVFAPTAAYRYRFDAFVPRQGTARGVVLERGRNVAAVLDAAVDSTRGRIINAATVVGAGGASVAVEDGGSQLARRRRETVTSLDGDDSSDAIRLGDVARGLMRASAPRALPRLALLPGAPDAGLDRIGLGDPVGVAIEEGWFGVRGDGYRVEQIVVGLTGGDRPVERLEVTLSEPSA